MSSTTSPPAGTDSLAARFERANQDLAALRRGASRSATSTLILGLFMVALLSFYFYSAYNAVREMTEPPQLVGVAQNLIDENLPQARESIQGVVNESAPQWAEGLSRQALAYAPRGREQIETMVLEQVDNAIEHQGLIGEDTFRNFLQTNRALIERDLKDLASTPQLAEARMNELVAALEAQYATDFKAQFQELFGALLTTNERLAQLQSGKDLTPADEVEREVLMLARRIQSERVGEPVRPGSLLGSADEEPEARARANAPREKAGPDASEDGIGPEAFQDEPKPETAQEPESTPSENDGEQP